MARQRLDAILASGGVRAPGGPPGLQNRCGGESSQAGSIPVRLRDAVTCGNPRAEETVWGTRRSLPIPPRSRRGGCDPFLPATEPGLAASRGSPVQATLRGPIAHRRTRLARAWRGYLADWWTPTALLGATSRGTREPSRRTARGTGRFHRGRRPGRSPTRCSALHLRDGEDDGEVEKQLQGRDALFALGPADRSRSFLQERGTSLSVAARAAGVMVVSTILAA